MDYEDEYYMNSKCLEGVWLHDYQIVKTYEQGVIEVCEHCKDRQYFPNNVSNRRYLAYHLKSSIQPGRKYFKKIYPNFQRK